MANKKKVYFCINCNTELDRENISNSRYRGKRKICKSCIKEERLTSKQNSNFNKDGLLICRVCNEYKTLDNFTQNRNNTPRKNHDTRCHCCKQKIRNSYLKVLNFEDRLKHIVRERVKGAEARAKLKNLPFDLNDDFIISLFYKQDGKCALSNIDITLNVREGRSPYNLSLDQIIPSNGYTKENIQIVCMAVNQLKSDFTEDVIINICKGIIKNASKFKH